MPRHAGTCRSCRTLYLATLVRAVALFLIRAYQRYVSPYNIAMIYNGLGERDEALAWLERGYREREPRMVLLKAEPKWNNLRDDPRFRDLVRRVGLPQ